MKSTEAKSWRNRIVGSDAVAPGDLLANPNNWRTHPGRQRDALRGALDAVGWVQQVIVNTTTGHLVDGHARVEEAITRGEPTVPVLYVELTPEEEGLVLATLDPISAMATQDDERLRQLLAEVEFDSRELAEAVTGLLPDAAKVGKTDPDDVPDPPAEPWVQRGDLFALGEHRLLCGDSTNADDVALVLGGDAPKVLWADPPYGIAFQAMRRSDKIANDQSPEAARKVVTDAITLVPTEARFVCCDWRSLPVILDALAVADIQPKATIVWDKGNGTQNLDRYAKAHEFVVYAGPFGGERTVATDVWQFPRDFQPDHPTPKPVGLVAKALETASSPGAVVYDPFAGSAPSIIAAEQTGRACRAVEIDPAYAQVAIERWEAFTGRKAEKL